MSRISIRFAKPKDAQRLVTDGVLGGPPPAGETWATRVAKWRSEQDAGRRAMLVAEDASGLLGMVQIVFRFPPGYTDAEAANGHDTAMIESLRTRQNAPAQVLDQLVSDAQVVAKNHRVTMLTLCLPLDNDRAILQAKSWGFSEFRLMPEATKMLAFFRKSIA